MWVRNWLDGTIDDVVTNSSWIVIKNGNRFASVRYFANRDALPSKVTSGE